MGEMKFHLPLYPIVSILSTPVEKRLAVKGGLGIGVIEYRSKKCHPSAMRIKREIDDGFFFRSIGKLSRWERLTVKINGC